MSEQDLRRTLQELHRELADVEDVDDDVAGLLTELQRDIEHVMERHEHQGLGERLGDAVERFETSHPKLASAMGAVMDQLARLGV